MKNISVKSFLLILSTSFLLTSCFWSLDVSQSISTTEEPLITTMVPDINAEFVRFKGDVIVRNSSEEFQYGFFWYDPNDSRSAENPNRIDVGTTTTSTEFSQVITSLPIGKDLVVCAFIDRGGVEEMTIGDEVTFLIP